ncbi:MAG: ribbon-helix-helix domain-containing protein [Candidatus Limnocylindrales bacterium]
MDMNKTTLYLPASTQRRLRELAKRTGQPQSELLRQAIDRYLGSESSVLPGSVGSGDDPQLSGRDSEGWLRTNWRIK